MYALLFVNKYPIIHDSPDNSESQPPVSEAKSSAEQRPMQKTSQIKPVHT